MAKTWLAAAYLLASSVAHASLIITSAPGKLMFAYLGGEAGPSLQEFGIGTPAEAASLADRNMVFAIDYRLPPVVVPIVNKGYFWAGSELDFYIAAVHSCPLDLLRDACTWTGLLRGCRSTLFL
ncbi:MAG TPA: hypothetical protein PLL14_03410 [Accumulibacter sp.]|nr:hypothetical protein [Accumulibacter sp.]